jgi:hypothetical protein
MAALSARTSAAIRVALSADALADQAHCCAFGKDDL